MKTIRSVCRRMLGMNALAWRFFLLSLQLSCLLLLGSLLLYTGVLGAATPQTRQLATALYELPEAVLLIGTLVSVCIEDVFSRRS